MHQQHKITHPLLTTLFLALVICLPLPLGSNRAWAWSIMEAWVFILAICTLISVYKNQLSLPKSFIAARPVLILLGVTLLWTGIQMSPLPLAVLKTLSPHAFELANAYANSGYASIALDSDLTAKSLLKGIFYITIMMLMLILLDNHRKIRLFAYAIIVAAVFQAAYGAYMVLSGIEYSFFIEKTAYRGMATGTFINRNHLAGYLEMSLAIGIGLMISTLDNDRAFNWRDRLRKLMETLLSPKAFIRLSLIIICIGLILTRSRMGNSAFFASLLITGALFLFTARHATRSTSIFLVSLIVLDILLIGTWVGLGEVAERIEHTTMETEHRDEIARDTISILRDFPVTGVGAGNYFIVLPSYQGLDINRHYYHAHDDYLEYATEYGIAGFLLFAFTVLYCMKTSFTAMRQKHSRLSLGMAYASFMGMLSILIHSTVDFNLQIPANAAMFAMLMGLAFISLHAGNEKYV